MDQEQDTPKFILVDSSVSGSGGHYLEYAEQVFDAAQAAGFSCVLIANTAFEPGPTLPARAYPVLPLDLWGNNLALRHDKNNVFTEDDRGFLRLRFGRVGVLWAAANNLEAVRHYAREVPLSTAAARNLAAQSSDRIPSSHHEERTLRYRALREAVRQAAQSRSAGTLRDGGLPGADGEAADGGAGELYQHSARAEAYTRAIDGVLREIGVGAHDIVFIPTLSFSEAAAVRNMLARSPTARRPSWCLLFRRDVYRGYTPDWEAQEWTVHAQRNLFASFVHLADRVRLKFLCDTEELSRQYRQFQAGPITTVAIPVRTRSAARPGSSPSVRSREPAAEGRIEIMYLRDSRFEHGFDYLPQILDTLTPDLLGRVRVSATEVASAPPAGKDDIGGMLSLARLRPYSADCYREIPEPRLRLDGWRAVMRLFQIAVFVEPQHARPSTFLDELDAAASAGAAVVVPKDTALAAVFEGTLSRQNPEARAFYYAEGETSGETAANLSEALAEAIRWRIEQSAGPRKDLNTWHLCYLGDAREEKGFAVLPEINDRLAMQVIKGRPIRIAAQGYQTGTSVDVEMLKGVDSLLRTAGDGTVVIQRPLPPDEYAGLIAGSDIVYNLYRRENYTARSSGVFVEAIACRKPVIATAGTWMSAVMGAHAPAYHREMVAPDAVVSEVLMPGTDVRWREIGELSGKHIDREMPPGQTARLAERVGIYNVFGRPDQANHLWLELALDSPFPDICIHLTLAWRGANLANIREDRVVLNRLGAGSLSAMLEVPRACEDLWLGLHVAHATVAVDLSWLRLRWVDVDRVAFLPGGHVVSEGPPAAMAESAAAAITTILSNYEAYRGSCEWLARHWADEQNAGQLLAGILDAPALTPQTRFSGVDW